MKVGRPRALDDAKKTEIIAIISVGGSRGDAAKYVGVAVTTIADEAKRDEAFSDSLLRAESECKMHHIRKIHRAKEWQASAWFMSRRYEEFREKKQGDDDADKGPPQVVFRKREVPNE